MTPEAERFNGWAAMLGFVAAVGAYVTTGQIIPGIFKDENKHTILCAPTTTGTSKSNRYRTSEGLGRDLEWQTCNDRFSCRCLF